MGCLMSTGLTAEERLIFENAQQLDKKLNEFQKADRSILKVLLLGTGESGKSTVFKQMQLLAGMSFTELEKTTFRHVIRKNVVQCMQVLIAGAETMEYEVDDNVLDDAKSIIGLDALTADFWNDDCAAQIGRLWEDDAMKLTYDRRNELQLLDSASYFFENVDRIGDPNYDPLPVDILRARLRTSGIVEKQLTIKKGTFQFMDVGGQRNERRKWLHCFDQVTAILFIVAMSEYDQVLYEDEDKNRMEESLDVWRKISGDDAFSETALILFLNKYDVFTKKMEDPLAHERLRKVIPTYDGKTAEEAQTCIQRKFVAVANEKKSKQPQIRGIDRVTCHFTTATDTKSIDHVFEGCRSIIQQANMRRIGML